MCGMVHLPAERPGKELLGPALSCGMSVSGRLPAALGCQGNHLSQRASITTGNYISNPADPCPKWGHLCNGALVKKLRFRNGRNR